MSFRLYDTASRTVRDFVPAQAGQVRIYVCGLTVQGPPHLGHIRKDVAFDVLRRWLDRLGYEVIVVANVTDIDDKILSKAEAANMPWWAWAYEHERALDRAYRLLGCKPPTYQPRATGHVPEMLELIDELLDRDHAYVAHDGSGDVYFDVRSWPAYGELSGQKLDEMEPATDADPRSKRDPRDFALWKGHKEGEPVTASWSSPHGRGRPGWHLECSAMAGKYLGDEFDIHGGGLDLRFPHHENELAQSRAAGRPFARFWMHNAMLNISGEKMSKSIGNSLLVDEMVKRFRPIDIRYYLIASHYRSVVDFSDEALAEAGSAFRRIEGFVERAEELLGERPGATLAPEAFTAAMNDDLGVPQALAVVFETVRAGNTALAEQDRSAVAASLASTLAMLDALGLDPREATWETPATAPDRSRETVAALVEELLDARARARADQDYATADRIRDRLAAAGVVVEDTPSGARWELAPPRGAATGSVT